MDAERQPLLGHTSTELRNRRSRPLSHEEVHAARQDVTWRRARFSLIIMFWGIMAMFMSIVSWILATAPKCSNNDSIMKVPSVPPVHLSVASLIASARSLQDGNVYTV